MNLRNIKESARVLEFLIRLEPPEKVAEYIDESKIADGVGTNETVNQYEAALAALKKKLGVR